MSHIQEKEIIKRKQEIKIEDKINQNSIIPTCEHRDIRITKARMLIEDRAAEIEFLDTIRSFERPVPSLKSTFLSSSPELHPASIFNHSKEKEEYLIFTDSTEKPFKSDPTIPQRFGIKCHMESYMQRSLPLHSNAKIVPEKLASSLRFEQESTTESEACINLEKIISLTEDSFFPKSIDLTKSKETTKSGPPSYRNTKEIKFTAVKNCRTVNGFELGPLLGKGRFGEVFLARHILTGFIVALKMFSKEKLKKSEASELLLREIKLHSYLRNPNIISFYGFFSNSTHFCIIMEYMNDGTLLDWLNRSLSDNESIKTRFQYVLKHIKSVLRAINYMHKNAIAHRDIKPENIVLNSEGVAKLCDFGWSAYVSKPRRTLCGTLDYAAPEMVSGKNYGIEVDIWCLGVLTYELVTGNSPFEGSSRSEICARITNCDENNLYYPPDTPVQAKSLIRLMLCNNPKDRQSCENLLALPIFNSNIKDCKNLKNSIFSS